MKKLALLLVLCVVSFSFSGCVFEIPGLTGARDVIDAYVYYSQTGELPENIEEILAVVSRESSDQIFQGSPEEILQSTMKTSKESEILGFAKRYYEMAYPQIESDTKSEYNRLITWKPDFSSKKASDEEIKLQKASSLNVILALSYTNAKNFYLAMATSVFSINAENPNAAGNFAAAVASYGDDLKLEGASSSSEIEKYYQDAEKIYHYGLFMAGRDGPYKQDALPLLISLGNLYLDGTKYEEAYACFQTALEISKEYPAAVEGLYNTYMALHQYQKALDLIADHPKFSAFMSASVKVSKKREEDYKKPGISESAADEEALKQKADSCNTIEAISTADFLDAIDAEAKDKLNALIRQVQGKMKYKAPEITLISQYASLKVISEPMGESALEAFWEAKDQYCTEYEELQDSLLLDEVPEETFQQIADYTEEYRRKKDRESAQKFFKAYSVAFPEFSIFTLNPYEYTNPVDLMVQRHNIENFHNKYLAYSSYIGVAVSKTVQNVNEIVNSCQTRVDTLWNEMNDKIAALGEDAGEEEVHRIHTSYYPKINEIKTVSWNQATQASVTAYQQKIKKYAEQMYNDCMKHVILISDEIIQKKLERKLKAGVMMGLASIYDLLYTSFSFVQYDSDCGCDIEGMKAAREARDKQREQLANQQIKKNMEAKKRFETGEIDENSALYKKMIKPYEVPINTPFVQGIVGPYKSTFKIKLDVPNTPVPTLEFEKVENHFRNTTTYNGGVEIGANEEIGDAEVGATAHVKFTATRGADGLFHVNDVDIIGGGKITLSTTYVSGEVGMEASAIRGTTSSASFSVTGDSLLNEDLASAMGDWTPNLTKELWNGEYPLY